MTYNNVVEVALGSFKKTETQTDVQRFARDLAKLLKGKVLPPNKDRLENTSFAEIAIGDNVLQISGNSYSAKSRVHVSITAPDVKDRNHYSSAKDSRPSDAYVNPDGRSIESIAKDITKRVIEASKPALAKQREYQAQLDASRSSIDAQIAKLTKEFPKISVRKSSPSDTTAHISSYGMNNSNYIDGRLNADGSVYLDRASVTAEQFKAIVRILAK